MAKLGSSRLKRYTDAASRISEPASAGTSRSSAGERTAVHVEKVVREALQCEGVHHCPDINTAAPTAIGV